MSLTYVENALPINRRSRLFMDRHQRMAEESELSLFAQTYTQNGSLTDEAHYEDQVKGTVLTSRGTSAYLHALQRMPEYLPPAARRITRTVRRRLYFLTLNSGTGAARSHLGYGAAALSVILP